MKHSNLRGGTNLGVLLALLMASTACSSTTSTSSDDGGTDGNGSDASSADDGSSGHDSGPSLTDSGTDSSSGVDAGAPDSGILTSTDGFGLVRTTCINEINRLRATQSLTPYAINNTDAEDMCVDQQATADEAAGVAHQSWTNNYPSAACDGNGQNECEGYPNTVSGITECLDDMWNEKENSDCAGCIGCTQVGGACANCNFSGTGGQPECGHYVNLSAVYYTSVACGFSTAPGTWAAQNFFE